MKNQRWIITGIILFLVIGLFACSTGEGAATDPEEMSTETEEMLEPTEEKVVTSIQPTEQPTSEPQPSEPPPVDPPPTGTSIPNTPTPEEAVLPPLPETPQRIEFEAADGQGLVGTYFPGTANPAPMVVMMHWAPGDGCDFRVMAPWLQNRGVEYDCQESMNGAWLDDSWFPVLAEDQSYAVFTFTFRGCEGSCSNFDRNGWVLDAQAAMKTAGELPGVDAERVAVVGASIGADGAAASCETGCLGAFSISPGDYLAFPYQDAIEHFGDLEPTKPAVCLAAEGDAESYNTCSPIDEDHFLFISYPGSEHGMMLIDPAIEPDVLEELLDFLGDLLGS